MTAQRAYKYRIYPGREQETLFHKTFGCCRFLYNHMLADRMDMYEKTGKMKRLTPAGYKKDYPWLKEVDSLALANVQLHLEAAYRRYFSAEKAGHPKFKSKHRSRKSYTTNVVNGNIRFEEGKLRLPKAGLVRIRLHREPPEGYILKSVTVSMDPSGKYYASLLYEPLLYEPPASENQTARENTVDEVQPQEGHEPEILGIDFAMRGLAVFSDGSRAEYPMFYREAQDRLAREQRKLSHCKKGSRNYGKQKKILAKAMSQCLKFGKSVMDDSFGMFRSMLGYKLSDRGKVLVRVGRFFPSSRKCSCCGKVKEELRLDERVYRCVCGNCMDRDVNAAVNIREEGRRLLISA